MSVSEARSSGRLRKRPRISYEEPDDGDLDIVDDGKEEELSRKHPGCIDKRRIFRWAELPAELRNAVYGLCLSREHPFHIRMVQHGRMKYDPYTVQLSNTTHRITSILLVNKAAFAEGNPILYQNEFEFFDPESMYIFLNSLSATTKGWLKKITLGNEWKAITRHVKGEFGSGYLLAALNSLVGSKRLERLQLGMNDERLTEKELERFAKRFLQMAHDWVHAVGKEKGDRMAAVGLIFWKERDYYRSKKRSLRSSAQSDEEILEQKRKRLEEWKEEQNAQLLRFRAELRKWVD